jgi:hypothetical protein
VGSNPTPSADFIEVFPSSRVENRHFCPTCPIAPHFVCDGLGSLAQVFLILDVVPLEDRPRLAAENLHHDTFTHACAAIASRSGSTEVVWGTLAGNLRCRARRAPEVVGEFADAFAVAVEDVADDDALLALEVTLAPALAISGPAFGAWYERDRRRA